MAAIGPVDDGTGVPVDDLIVREPRQRRTREQWDRVLDSGVRLLEQGGYEAFTIAALCDLADVPPRALYARVATRDALFLAVYERGMSRVVSSHRPFTEHDLWESLDDRERIAHAVRCLVGIFVDHAAFLCAVVLVSGAHPEVRRRGEAYRAQVRDLFGSVLTPVDTTSQHPDPKAAREFCFSLIFSTMVVRTAYGQAFGPGDDGLCEELVTMAHRYLLPADQVVGS